MKVTEAIKRVEASKEYGKYMKERPDSFLAHAFTMKEDEGFESWQLGYYSPKKDKITVFELGESVKMLPESDVFKKEETIVKRLDLAKLRLDIDQAIEAAYKVNKEHYPQVLSNKQILILQNIEEGQVWNITFISPGMDVLNIKIASEDGKVISHHLSRLFEFKNFQDKPLVG
jgi:hypothetical protein